MIIRAARGVGAFLVFVFAFGTTLKPADGFGSVVVSTPVLTLVAPEITASKAYAIGSRRAWRKAKRKAAEEAARNEEQKRRDEREEALQGTVTTELPANCVYDTYASAANSTELYLCGGNYYQRYEENGKTGFVAHPVDMNRGEIERAMARRAAAERKRNVDKAKQLQERRKPTLPPTCWYNTYASAVSTTDVYSCGEVDFRRYEENGMSGYEAIVPPPR